MLLNPTGGRHPQQPLAAQNPREGGFGQPGGSCFKKGFFLSFTTWREGAGPLGLRSLGLSVGKYSGCQGPTLLMAHALQETSVDSRGLPAGLFSCDPRRLRADIWYQVSGGTKRAFSGKVGKAFLCWPGVGDRLGVLGRRKGLECSSQGSSTSSGGSGHRGHGGK